MKSKTRNSSHSWLEGIALNFNLSLMLLFFIILSSCKWDDTVRADNMNNSEETSEMYKHLTSNNYVSDIVKHPAFKGFSEMLLPRDDNSNYYNTQLGNVGSLMPYHGHVDPDIVVGSINHMIDEVNEGKKIFYDFYTEQQKVEDRAKEFTGLFLLQGKAECTICHCLSRRRVSMSVPFMKDFRLHWK